MSENRFLEDFLVGEIFTTGGVTITEGEIIHFALQYDPQPFHLDITAGLKSPYKGLIASGFFTAAICFRMFIQMGIFSVCSIGSPGVDELRWLAPVRPGDTLKTETRILEIRPSASKPDRGILRMKYVGTNQNGTSVVSFIVNHLLRRGNK